MKLVFEELQSKLNKISLEFYKQDPNGYQFVCSVIIEESGWTEEEYMGILISRLYPDLFIN
jgi:hypothetical protein